ncbi:DUF975 family protein [Clostridium septicum]|uniref:DUF975 domain-containing protein n=1 Tax=Clostridium septicum TaxID=1504 RepID=A0A9N7JJP0_CLOSE|nr:DUF975 family protein [Clostridium septicum]AYE33580.1 DUF975 domain-containing protein [Clostridium septicum]QAS61744.1 DUF975 family protein [Clostridium septicum]UEC21809.1 DUF975 family protein [Clostridium septicum]USS00139.1 DUF975 family protein [Clostridium septicum]WLF68686.1 DUF975 family protein [Clostridium septicum]
MIIRRELKSNSKDQLRGNWGLAIITILVYSLIISIFGYSDSIYNNNIEIILDLSSLLLSGVLTLGISKFLLNLTKKDSSAKFTDLFSGFNVYFKTLGLNILLGIIIGIGTIFLVVPGLIFALMFSQTFFILSEDNEKGIIQCLSESREMMIGYKFDYFVLMLSFLGWWLVSALTLGIGALWVYPYQKLTEANFYLEIKSK